MFGRGAYGPRYLLTGAGAYTLAGFFIARRPWIPGHFEIFLLLALGLIFILFLIRRLGLAVRAEGPELSATRALGLRAIFFAAGVCLAWLLIFELGNARYSQALARMEASGIHPAYPVNDSVERSEKNGQVILYTLSQDLPFVRSWDASSHDKQNDGTLYWDFSAALSSARDAGQKLGPAAAKLALHKAQWQPALKALDRAQAAPMFSWNMRYDVPVFQMERPDLGLLMKVSRSICAEAIILTAQAKPAMAEHRLLQVLWLSKAVRGYPGVTASMVAVAMDNMVLDVSNALFRGGHGAKIAAALGNDGIEDSVRQGLELDFFELPLGLHQCSGLAAFRDIYFLFAEAYDSGDWFHNRPIHPSFSGIAMGMAYAPWLNWDAASEMDNSIAFAHCLAFPAMDAIPCVDGIMQQAEVGGWLLQAVSLPRNGWTLFKAVSCSTRQRLAQLAFAAGAFKKAHQRWPKALAELGGTGKLLDPFSLQPFVLHYEKDGIEFSSDGASLVPGLKGQMPDSMLHISVKL